MRIYLSFIGLLVFHLFLLLQPPNNQSNTCVSWANSLRLNKIHLEMNWKSSEIAMDFFGCKPPEWNTHTIWREKIFRFQHDSCGKRVKIIVYYFPIIYFVINSIFLVFMVAVTRAADVQVFTHTSATRSRLDFCFFYMVFAFHQWRRSPSQMAKGQNISNGETGRHQEPCKAITKRLTHHPT